MQRREHDAKLAAPEVRVVGQVFDHVHLGAELQYPGPDHDVLEHGKELVHAPAVLLPTQGLPGPVDLPECLEQHVELLERGEGCLDLLQRLDGRNEVLVADVGDALAGNGEAVGRRRRRRSLGPRSVAAGLERPELLVDAKEGQQRDVWMTIPFEDPESLLRRAESIRDFMSEYKRIHPLSDS